MNFISIFDSFRAFVSTPLPSDPRYIPDPTLSICKAFRSYNFTKTLKTLQTFHGNLHSRGSRRRKKEGNKLSAAENYSDYANSFSSTSLAICSMSTPHPNLRDLWRGGEQTKIQTFRKGAD